MSLHSNRRDFSTETPKNKCQECKMCIVPQKSLHVVLIQQHIHTAHCESVVFISYAALFLSLMFRV